MAPETHTTWISSRKNLPVHYNDSSEQPPAAASLRAPWAFKLEPYSSWKVLTSSGALGCTPGRFHPTWGSSSNGQFVLRSPKLAESLSDLHHSLMLSLPRPPSPTFSFTGTPPPTNLWHSDFISVSASWGTQTSYYLVQNYIHANRYSNHSFWIPLRHKPCWRNLHFN